MRRADQVLISAVVAGELLFGFRNGSRFEANARRLDDFLASPYVAFLPVTLVTADRFARIAAGRGDPARFVKGLHLKLGAKPAEVRRRGARLDFGV